MSSVSPFNFDNMNTSEKNLSLLSRVFLAAAAVALFVSVYVPIWRIELDAPQYPEGLALQIHADKLGGDVEIINGLNHYIGMRTLHAEDFIEFTVLKYIIWFFAICSLVAAVVARKKVAYMLFGAFVLFGILAMVDFWRWEYNYGHNLDPNAAIIVPGMAYQPPLIGFKQLLNFGAFSIPDTGGWLFIAAGLLMLWVTLSESKVLNRFSKKSTPALALLTLMLLSSCGNKGPLPVKVNADGCAFCKMTIADARFASEIVTSKGRVYKFDDISCMMRYDKENEQQETPQLYVTDFVHPDKFILLDAAILVAGDQVGSPMGGNVAAFSDMQEATTYMGKWRAAVVTAAALKE